MHQGTPCNSIHVTEFDQSQNPGSFAFEICDHEMTFYVIRNADGTYQHMDAHFTEIECDKAANNREIVVASYMAKNARHFS